MKYTKCLVFILLLTALFVLAGCSEEVTIDCSPASGTPLSDIPVSVSYAGMCANMVFSYRWKPI